MSGRAPTHDHALPSEGISPAERIPGIGLFNGHATMHTKHGYVGLAIALAAVYLVAGVACGELAELAYSYRNDRAGGVALLQIDTDSGTIVDQRVLLETATCGHPNKLRRTADRQLFVLANESDREPHMFLAARDETKRPAITLPAMPDELRVTDHLAIATCDDDWIALVDLQQGEVVGRWNVGKLLAPPGNMPESVEVAPAATHAVVSLQKDSAKGKKFGSRLAIFTWPAMQLVADIRLPRTHPELHIPGNLQEQGPCPEVVFVAESTDTLLTTLDLYGAVAVMDWSAAKMGTLANCQYLPTSMDGAWGTAFPDRATLFALAGQPHVLVCNAGAGGGA
ncbi:MAG: hypothetical protein A2W31_08725, partial [Planctomycetes bacterium RBG_16_64_10]